MRPTAEVFTSSRLLHVLNGRPIELLRTQNCYARWRPAIRVEVMSYERNRKLEVLGDRTGLNESMSSTSLCCPPPQRRDGSATAQLQTRKTKPTVRPVVQADRPSYKRMMHIVIFLQQLHCNTFGLCCFLVGFH